MIVREAKIIMKRKRLVLVSILFLLFCLGSSLEVSAESYIAPEAQNYIRLSASRSWTNADGSIGEAELYNESLSAANVGFYHHHDYWKRRGFIIDLHTSVMTDELTSENMQNVRFKVFAIDETAGTNMTTLNIMDWYIKQEDQVNYGIVHIITNAESYLSKNGIDLATRTYGDFELSWFTQVAIWKYQNINNFADISMTSPDLIYYLCPEKATCGEIMETKVSSSAITLWNLADELVAEAKRLDSSFSYDGNYSIEENKKKVKTTLISPLSTDSISSYSLDISKAPIGTKVYIESGSEITNLSNIPNSTKFYLEIPVESIENFTYDFNITAAINYRYKGYKYQGREYKNLLVSVIEEPQQFNSTIKLKATHVEDSASFISKITYIGGLFVLLCGVFIVYFNIISKKKKV